MNKTDITLNLFIVGLEILLVGFLARRRLYSRFPLFFIYLIGSIFIELVRILVASDYRQYFIAFWITFPLYELLIVLALYEVFHQVFIDYYEAWPWFRWLFPGAVVLVVGISLSYAFAYPPVQASRLIGALLVLGFAVKFMQTVLFVLFFFLVRHFEMWWRAYAYGIVMGFGIAALGEWVPYWLRYDFGKNFNAVVKYTPPVAYIIAVVFWLDVFHRPEPDMRVKLPFGPDEALPALKRTVEALRRIREKLK